MIIKPITIKEEELQPIINIITSDSLGRIFIIGNGGSHANAVHFASDLREIGFDADALDNSANITAIANDFGYEEIFKEQLIQKHLDTFDLLIAISGSGNSKNILQAVKYAEKIGTTIISITMAHNGKLRKKGIPMLVDTKNMEDFETTTMGIIHSFKKLLRGF